MAYHSERNTASVEVNAFAGVARMVATPQGIVMLALLGVGFFVLQEAMNDAGNTLENRSGRYWEYDSSGVNKTRLVGYGDSESDSGDPDQDQEPPKCSACGGAKIVPKWNENKTVVIGTQTCPDCKGTGLAT